MAREAIMPDEMKWSNAVVVNGAQMPLPAALVAAGVTASNYLADGEPRFAPKGQLKPGALRNLVLHETVGNTARGAKRTFSAGRFAAQLILSEAGHLSCHADLARDLLWHGNQLNGCSVGIEVVNPYLPEIAKLPFGTTIPREWWCWAPKGKRQEYVLPMPCQVEALKRLVPWLCELLGIPFAFPTASLDARRQRILGWDAKPAARPEPGVVAHRDFAGHADGRYLLEKVMGMR
jgi:hypothetical protein